METIAQETLKKGQIKKIQRDFSRFVYDLSDLDISDYEYSDDKIRVFVDFDRCLREIVIKNIEILDNDYEPIHNEYTLTLRHFIQHEIADYNKQEIGRDQREADELAHRNYVMFGLHY